MKNNSGVTLLEILIAISILTLVLFAGSGIYISGMNLSLNAQRMAQAYRNAQVAMMHIEKNVRDAGSNFDILDGGSTLRFDVYTGGPMIRREYRLEGTPLNRMRFTDSSRPTEIVIFGHIANCNFDITPTDGVILNVRIDAFDNGNRAENIYVLDTSIEAEFTASPSMYIVS